jgi:hypothetical protein
MTVFETASLCEATGWVEKNFRNALERGHHAPRLGKTGGRYEFSVEDIADAAIMRHLVAVGVPVKIASSKARNFVNGYFRIIPKKSRPLTLNRLGKGGEGQFLQIRLSNGDVELANMDRLDLTPIPANARVCIKFDNKPMTVFLVSLGEVFKSASTVLAKPI